MSSYWHRIALAAIAVILLSFLATGAEARRHHHHRHYGQYSQRGQHSQHVQRNQRGRREHEQLVTQLPAGPVGNLMRELIGDCDRQLFDLKNLPTNSIAQTIEPDDAQATALENIHRIAEKTADALTASCPLQDAGEPPLRLAAAEQGLEAVETAMNSLQQPLETFYQSLRDEQKERLASTAPAPDTDVSGATPADLPRHRRPRRENGPPVLAWDCDQWIEQLRNWPVDQVLRALNLMPRQRGTFYELAASFQFAADNLEDSCPRQDRPTPIGRLLYMKDKLQALHQSANIIGVPLRHLYDILDDGQKTRFGAQM